VNAEKVAKIVEIAEEVEDKAIEKEIEKAPPAKAKVPRAKKIKSAEKVQLSDFVPIEEDVEPAPEKEEVPGKVPDKDTAGAKDKDQDKDKTKAARCKDGTKKYKPMGDGCYTDEEIAAYKLNKTKKTTDKK
jgi:hypothetical protein